MTIRDSKRIEDIQREFSDKFPYLKIEFYQKAHALGAGSSDANLILSKSLIGDVRAIHTEGDLNISEELTVAEVETKFAKKYGLHAQIFRRSSGLWLQTTATDHWTLHQQNGKGKEEAQPIEHKEF